MDNHRQVLQDDGVRARGDRVIVLLSSGNLAGTQAVIGVLNQRCVAGDAATNLWSARTMFDVAMLVADAMRDIERRDGEYLQENEIGFNASFIVGGQISGEPLRLFRIYAEGNFIEAGIDTPYFRQENKGKRSSTRDYAFTPRRRHEVRAGVIRFTMRSNLSGGMPMPDLYERTPGSAEAAPFRRGDAYSLDSARWRRVHERCFARCPDCTGDRQRRSILPLPLEHAATGYLALRRLFRGDGRWDSHAGTIRCARQGGTGRAFGRRS